MSARRDIRGPACEACGYSLEGINATESGSVCPECGEAVDGAKPWSARAWPRGPMLWLKLCGPGAAVCAGLLVAASQRTVRGLLFWPLWLVWLVVIVLMVLVWPVATAKGLSRECEPRMSRDAAARRLIAGSLTVNLAILGATLMAIWALI